MIDEVITISTVRKGSCAVPLLLLLQPCLKQKTLKLSPISTGFPTMKLLRAFSGAHTQIHLLLYMTNNTSIYTYIQARCFKMFCPFLLNIILLNFFVLRKSSSCSPSAWPSEFLCAVGGIFEAKLCEQWAWIQHRHCLHHFSKKVSSFPFLYLYPWSKFG